MLTKETGTLTCIHVAEGEEVTFVCHDTDGSWQHLCDHDHTEATASDFVIVGIDHLETRQPELVRFRQLEPGWVVQRAKNGAWTRHRDPPIAS